MSWTKIKLPEALVAVVTTAKYSTESSTPNYEKSTTIRGRKTTKRRKGFTLIELVIVFAIIGVISSIGYVSIRGFAQNQEVNTSAKDFFQAAQLARSRAQTQVKPETGACLTDPLRGYKVTVNCTSSGRCDSYRVNGICGVSAEAPAILSRSFPVSVNVTATGDFEPNSTSVVFEVLSGTVSGIGSAAQYSFGNANGSGDAVTIYQDGRIVNATDVALPTFTPTPIPRTPTPTRIPTVTMTPTRAPTPIPTATPVPVYVQSSINCSTGQRTMNQVCQANGYTRAVAINGSYAAKSYYWKECAGASVTSCNGIECTIRALDCRQEAGQNFSDPTVRLWGMQNPQSNGNSYDPNWISYLQTTGYLNPAQLVNPSCSGFNPGWTIRVACQ